MPAGGNGNIRWFEDFSAGDIAAVGGKNASLGEMIATLQDAGIRVPRGFAITTDAYWRLVRHFGSRRRCRMRDVHEKSHHGDHRPKNAPGEARITPPTVL